MHFIELLTNAHTYTKPFKQYDMRRDLAQWKSVLPVLARADGQMLQLCGDRPRPSAQRLLVAQAHNWHTKADFGAQQRLLGHTAAPSEAEWTRWAGSRRTMAVHQLGRQRIDAAIFQIVPSDAGLELWLNGDYWTVGAPERGRFRIALLRPQQTVAVKIDGKRDFTATGRQARLYVEQEYRITYFGALAEMQPATGLLQQPPPQPTVTVDLLRHVR